MSHPRRRKNDAWLQNPQVLAALADSLCPCHDCDDWLLRHPDAVWRCLDFSFLQWVKDPDR